MGVTIRVESLSVKRLKAIADFSLPRDGLGWNDRLPDTLLLGGLNGSGKTTVLELIFQAAQLIAKGTNNRYLNNIWYANTGPQSEKAIEFSFGGLATSQFKLSSGAAKTPNSGSASVADVHVTPHLLPEHPAVSASSASSELTRQLVGSSHGEKSACGTGVLFIPSERDLLLPNTTIKTPGRLEDHEEFAWQWVPPRQWQQSAEAVLYSARWADLNAKENGAIPSRFASYQKAFAHFFGHEKMLFWTSEGDLVVRRADGEVHDLPALSAGEKQVLVLCAEIERRWRPGSLVLIDEPELHLHEQWIGKLWEYLCQVRSERGGQLIVATQSDHLFRIAPAGSKAIIGRA